MEAPLAALTTASARHPGALIDNLVTTIAPAQLGPVTIPVTCNDGRAKTCYICCPSVAYIDYALAELRHFTAHPALKTALKALIHAGAPLLALTGVDRHIQLNNWLLATNPLPPLDLAHLKTLTAELTTRHPRHAVVWRSANRLTDAAALKTFAAAGYDLFPARQIYLFDCRKTLPPLHRDERRDRALLAQPGYRLVGPADLTPADYPRMAELYGMLYLDKYTRLNPQYSAAFIAMAQQSGMLTFHGLRNPAGQLDGILGYFDRGDTMTVPLIGYDTALPQSLGLYRRLMAHALARARDNRLLFNMSAGAAGFKRNRGGVPAVEYAAVYLRHLPVRQRLAGWIVRIILVRLGESLLTRFEL